MFYRTFHDTMQITSNKSIEGLEPSYNFKFHIFLDIISVQLHFSLVVCELYFLCKNNEYPPPPTVRVCLLIWGILT